VVITRLGLRAMLLERAIKREAAAEATPHGSLENWAPRGENLLPKFADKIDKRNEAGEPHAGPGATTTGLNHCFKLAPHEPFLTNGPSGHTLQWQLTAGHGHHRQGRVTAGDAARIHCTNYLTNSFAQRLIAQILRQICSAEMLLKRRARASGKARAF
jgi:hypothetical protein